VRRLAAYVAAVLVLAPASVRAQVPDWPSERPPRPLAARDVRFPPYETKTLANGLQVIAVSHHEQPAVSLRLLFKAGGAQDPVDKPGVASLAAALLDQGTTTKSAEQIATSIDSIGGAIGAGSSAELTSIGSVVMKDSFAFALDLVSDIARNPAFAPEEIDRQRQQILSGLKVSYDDPEYLAGVVFDRLVYGFHPYGRPDAGTPKSIATITREDLVQFHKNWFAPNNAILAVVGDVTAAEAFAGVERAFGKWERTELPAAKSMEAPPPTRRLIVIDRPGAVQTEIRVGHSGLPRKHPDYLALDLAIKILGGEGGNRLHRVLRSERGLTYGASADIHALKDGGDLVAETDTRSETTGEALRLIVDEMWRLQRQRVSERELADAQAYLTGSFPLTIETPSAIALQILNAMFYGLDLNELQTYRERVNAITVDDIQRVARQYLRPDRLSIVLVGDSTQFAKQLAGLGFEQFERIPASELDLAAADLRRQPAGPVGGRIAPVSFERSGRDQTAAPAQTGSAPPAKTEPDARTLIDRAVEAKGGLQKLRGIRTLKAINEHTVHSVTDETGQKPTTFRSTTVIRYPGEFRVDMNVPGTTMIQVFDGGQYWVQDHEGVKTAPAEMAAAIKSNVQRDTIQMLLAVVDGKIVARREPDVDGAPALTIEGTEMRPVTIVLDPKTSLILRQRFAGPRNVAVEEQFTDYRAVDGIQVAFRATVLYGGQPQLVRKVERIEFNVPVPATFFTRPTQARG
jgi:zinc protease